MRSTISVRMPREVARLSRTRPIPGDPNAAPSLTTGKDAQGRGIAGQGGLAALGDDAVLAHLLPAESLLRRAALGHPIVVRPDHEVVALVREPGQVRSIPQAPTEP